MKINRLLSSTREFLEASLNKQPYSIEMKHGFRVWTRGDGVRYKDPTRLGFATIDERDRAFNLLQFWLTDAKPIQVTGEFGRDPDREGLKWKGKMFFKYGDFSIAIKTVTKSGVFSERVEQ